jgi:hypothetical protein
MQWWVINNERTRTCVGQLSAAGGLLVITNVTRSKTIAVYRVSQEERSIFREVIVSVIPSKKVYMNMCPLPNGFQDRAIRTYNSLALAPNIVPPTVLRHCLKHVHRCERRVDGMTVDSDVVRVLWSDTHGHKCRICGYAVRLRLLWW